MWNCVSRSVATLLIFLCPLAFAADDAKPDKRKSQAALQRGLKAEQAGKREEAMAAFTEAVQADGSNVDALRARARAYQAAGDSTRAQADLDKAVETAPGNSEIYAARG